MIKVLFICTGNICRSPTAEGVFRALVHEAGLENEIEIDSVGTGSWHAGRSPDQRSQDAAALRGIDISDQRSRQIGSDDILNSDYLIAMDKSNVDNLKLMVPPKMRDKLMLFLKFAPSQDREDVPDPYYGGGPGGFEIVLDLVEDASRGLLTYICHNDL